MAWKNEELKKLKVPYYDTDENKGHYEVNTLEEKIVSKYAGYNFKEIDNLDVFEYWILLRDAVIYNCMQSESGQEYLENCWRMEQTEPDRESLRENFKKD